MGNEPKQDDLSHEADHLVENTGNGAQPDDPSDQPSQDPGHLPEGTETEAK
jgi:hypothetical protein